MIPRVPDAKRPRYEAQKDLAVAGYHSLSDLLGSALFYKICRLDFSRRANDMKSRAGVVRAMPLGSVMGSGSRTGTLGILADFAVAK